MYKNQKCVTDLYWEYDRISHSGQQTLDRLAKMVGVKTEDQMMRAFEKNVSRRNAKRTGGQIMTLECNKKMYDIVSTKIYAEWNGSPKMVLIEQEMPQELQLLFDSWLSDIENEENAK